MTDHHAGQLSMLLMDDSPAHIGALFDALRHLKDNPQSQLLPVILAKTADDVGEQAKDTQFSGAVRYIAKPIHHEEAAACMTCLDMRKSIHCLQLEKDPTIASPPICMAIKTLQSQNNELNAFAHTVAHDLKNPLNAIMGLVDVIFQLNASTLGQESVTCLHDLQDAAHKMSEIIESLLLLARASNQEVVLEPISMVDIIKQVRRRLSYMMALNHVELCIPEQWSTAIGYAPWVEEIWANYLSNAIKYGGCPPKIRIGSTLRKNDVCFWVQDNGDGLTKAEQSKLFTPFTRLHKKQISGHGLGLSIVRRMVERLGGEAGVKSNPGQGSKFYFTLPKRDVTS